MTIPTYLNPGQTLYASGVVGMEELNGRELTIITNDNNNPATLTFAISPSEDDYSGSNNIDSTSFGAYVSGGTLSPVLEISHSYAEADLADIQFIQSDDVLYLVHPSYAPQKLVRQTDDQGWFLQTVHFTDGPYLDIPGGSAGTMTYDVGAGTVTASSGNTFASTDVGRLIRIYDKTTSKWVWSTISSYTSATVAHVAAFNSAGTSDGVGLTDGNAADATQWRLGAWSGTTGYPTTAVFHQDRLVMGGSATSPARFDGSNASDYENFTPTDGSGNVTAANAYGFNLASQDFNQIVWMTSDERGLLIGTTSAEWVVTGADSGSALSATSVSANKTSSAGGQEVQAAQLGKSSLFVQRGGTRIRELYPNIYTASGFQSPDISEYAEHITKSGIIALAVQKVSQPIVWMVRSDGVLVSLTYEKTTDSIKAGFARHYFGGSLSDGSSPVVESVCVIPSADSDDQVWVSVERYINGHTLRYIEYLTPLFKTYTNIKDAVQMDSSLTYDGTATKTISGLNHLNGQSLSVLADGAQLANVTPVNGRVTLPSAAAKVTLGLAYASKGQKLRSDAGSANGTGVGKTRRTNRVGFHLLNTQGFKFGPDFSTLDTLSLDSTQAGVLVDNSSLFTGITTQLLSGQYDFDNMFCWQQDGPFPGTVVGIFPDFETQDR